MTEDWEAAAWWVDAMNVREARAALHRVLDRMTAWGRYDDGDNIANATRETSANIVVDAIMNRTEP